MRLPARFAPPLLALMLAACTSIDVSTQHDGSAARAVSGYRTYAWMPRASGGSPAQGGETGSHVEKSVDGFLTARGYKRVEASASPDFLIKWSGAIRDLQAREVVDNAPAPVGPMQSPYDTPNPRPQPRTYLREFSKGELDLDIVDASTKKLVWRGTAKGNLDKKSTPAEEQEWLNQAITQLLSDFSPQPAKN
ncbi:DUF4136 domain-containing protein [Pyxidicoccus trucidator]|uniref:DUF4136 domain-containing protein n=1 Tax=Pyxidicoccus trucidator TaxID=2709662 RepID=UPI0013DCC142|nr:DUF4136 domain-containing protein [Pyxidicoccus trucidator]